MKKIRHIANAYWGDIIFCLLAPVLLVFDIQVTKTVPVTPEGDFLPVVGMGGAVSMFILYFIVVVVSIVRLIFLKKRALRDWTYLIAGIVATQCFVGYFRFDSALVSQRVFVRNFNMLTIIGVSFLSARIAIWLYNVWQEEPSQTSEPSAPPTNKEEPAGEPR